MKLLLKSIPFLIIFGLITYLIYPSLYNGGVYTANLKVLDANTNTSVNKDISIYVYRESPTEGEFFIDIKIDSDEIKNSNLIKLDERFFILGQAEKNNQSLSKIDCQIVLAIGMLTKKSFNEYEIDLNFASYCNSNDLFTSFKVQGNLKRQIKDKRDPLIKLS